VIAAHAPKRILLIIGGGIAAYKSLELVRLLKKQGVSVRVVLTKAAQQFVTPLSAAALSGEPVHTDLFDLKDETEMGHIVLSRQADLVVVAPATADLMAKLATGRADDLASTLLLATDKPVVMAPAMNVRMWQHAATQRNIETLKSDGVRFIGPEEGDMACGEYGPGRMSEPVDIVRALLFQEVAPTERTLSGCHVVVTAGPTFEAIDPVRGLTNRSSGKQGFAVAEAMAAAGAKVTLISGPVNLPTPAGATRIDVESSQEMLDAAHAALPCNVFIGVAAVADWRPQAPATEKQKKGRSQTTNSIDLVRTPDILKSIGTHSRLRPDLVIGFAAETQNLEAYARSKLQTKGCDAILANDVTRGVFGSDTNHAMLVLPSETVPLGRRSKTEVAQVLKRFIEDKRADT
jgi:phosphopantothenoylcysteine decarboxylase/phosphopantothenate--cysteine ligase